MDTTAAQVVALLESGMRQCDVARQLNLSRFAVRRRVFQRYQVTGDFDRRRGSGRQRCTTERDDRFIVSTSLRNRFLNAVELQQQLHVARSTSVSISTVRRRLRERKIVARRLLLLVRNRLHSTARHGCSSPVNMLIGLSTNGGLYLFSDETRVCLFCNDRRRSRANGLHKPVLRRQWSMEVAHACSGAAFPSTARPSFCAFPGAVVFADKDR